MIKIVQNWIDVRKQYKLEQKRQELIKVAKVMISDIMRELIKYDIDCSFEISKIFDHGIFVLKWSDKHINFIIGGFNKNTKINIKAGGFIDIFQEDNKIATYEHLKWYQLAKKGTRKKFYYAEDAVRAISNMIIMGESI